MAITFFSVSCCEEVMYIYQQFKSDSAISVKSIYSQKNRPVRTIFQMFWAYFMHFPMVNYHIEHFNLLS